MEFGNNSNTEMSFAEKLIRFYFNYIYNPVYDFTVAQLHTYWKLQESCVEKLKLQNNDSVLCVGLGTGNEITQIVRINREVTIVGVDYSATALQRANNRAQKLGKSIETYIMDTQFLQFPAESFDKVLCIHVMDFVEDRDKATKEILRVLKDNGYFVITYPSDKENLELGQSILGDSVNYHIEKGQTPIMAFFKSVTQLVMSSVFLPLFLRPNKETYTREGLKTMINTITKGAITIEEYPVYHDYIVYGQKYLVKGESCANGR